MKLTKRPAGLVWDFGPSSAGVKCIFRNAFVRYDNKATWSPVRGDPMQGSLVNGAGKGAVRRAFVQAVLERPAWQIAARAAADYMFMHQEEECRVDRLTRNGIMPVQYDLH